MTTQEANHPQLLKWPCETLPFHQTFSGIAQRYRLHWLRRIQPVFLALPLLLFARVFPGKWSYVGFFFALAIPAAMALLDYRMWIEPVADLLRITRDNLSPNRAKWKELEQQWTRLRESVVNGSAPDLDAITDQVPAFPEIVWPLAIVDDDVPAVPVPNTLALSTQQLDECERRVHGNVVRKLAESGFNGIVLKTVLEGSATLAIGIMAGDTTQQWVLARLHQTPTGLAYGIRSGLAYWINEGVLKSGQYYRGDRRQLARVLRRTYFYVTSLGGIAAMVIMTMVSGGTMIPLASANESYSPYIALPASFLLASFFAMAHCVRGRPFYPSLYSAGARHGLRMVYQNRYPDVPGEFGDLALLKSAREDTAALGPQWVGPDLGVTARAQAIRQQIVQAFQYAVLQR